MTGLLLLISLAAAVAAAPEVEAGLQVGWLEYGDLWTGDPILGGFDLRSPPAPLDRLLVAPVLTATARAGTAHRFRITASGRTLSRITLLDEDLEVVHVLASDGVPVSEAWRERLFLDEASWRWRPGGDPAVDLRAGILPYAVAGNRLFVESWPGARLRWDAQRQGLAPLVAEARVADTLRGATMAALSVGHEPSLFEFVGVEAAWTRDRLGGVAPLLEQDLGMMLELWRGTSAEFFQRYPDEVLGGLYDLYGHEVDGVRMLQADLATFLDLQGTADLLHLSLLGRVVAGGLLLDGAFVLARGRATVTGWRIPDGTPWADVATPAWATDAPREAFTGDLDLRGHAVDLAISGLGAERWPWLVFVQGVSGDADLAQHALSGEPVTAFLATDQRFVRTRLFPVETAGTSGSLSLPPGVAGHGLLTPGLRLGRRWARVEPTLQVALPLAPEPAPLPPHGRIYGLEADLLVTAELAGGTRAFLEGGAFQPGTFFLDASSFDRDHPLELPLGWRVFAGISIAPP